MGVCNRRTQAKNPEHARTQPPTHLAAHASRDLAACAARIAASPTATSSKTAAATARQRACSASSAASSDSTAWRQVGSSRSIAEWRAVPQVPSRTEPRESAGAKRNEPGPAHLIKRCCVSCLGRLCRPSALGLRNALCVSVSAALPSVRRADWQQGVFHGQLHTSPRTCQAVAMVGTAPALMAVT